MTEKMKLQEKIERILRYLATPEGQRELEKSFLHPLRRRLVLLPPPKKLLPLDEEADA